MADKYLLSNNMILKVVQDEDADSPNDWGNTDMFLVYDHRSFHVTRDGFKPRDIFDYLQDDEDNTYDEYYIFPVYAYIHSGVALSLGNGSYPFNDRFDVSTTGFYLVHKTEMDFDMQRNSDHYKEKLSGKTDEEIALFFAEAQIETWNTYLRGEVYGFIAYEKVLWTKIFKNGETEEGYDLEERDSCWGFYECSGRDELLECMIEHISGEDIKVVEQINK